MSATSRSSYFPTDAGTLPPEHNVEMRWDQVDPDEYLTPNARFFVRSHSVAPAVEASAWRLRIDGDGVERALRITYDDLLAEPAESRVCALECAGNGRAMFERTHGRMPPGAPWGLGAIGVAEWTGVRLADLLSRAGVRSEAVEAVPEGVDELRVRRPLPIGRALRDDVLVAYLMNGEPLPADHGFPARLIVPGWAAVASVKWLGRIEVTTRPVFTWWNTEHYVLRGDGYAAEGPGQGQVIAEQVMKSAFELPWPARLPPGRRVLYGRSWSPTEVITRVEVSDDGGAHWSPAVLRDPNLPGAWVRWSFEWRASPGHHELRARATDALGRTQPDSVSWNERGYLYGGVVDHPVDVI